MGPALGKMPHKPTPPTVTSVYSEALVHGAHGGQVCRGAKQRGACCCSTAVVGPWT